MGGAFGSDKLRVQLETCVADGEKDWRSDVHETERSGNRAPVPTPTTRVTPAGLGADPAGALDSGRVTAVGSSCAGVSRAHEIVVSAAHGRALGFYRLCIG
jgi:hypothetical protein